MYSSIRRMMRGWKSMAIDQRGMTLDHQETQVGGRVSSIQGFKMPMLLRLVSGFEGKPIGEIYVHGVIDDGGFEASGQLCFDEFE
ncbi:hypothetical protein N431DRAFT_132303 [Stipitochalara longipes BDJ]|nr:hypothetical protein N431DRAFT_132303 [Stipitochalara longipes BDJ]